MKKLPFLLSAFGLFMLFVVVAIPASAQTLTSVSWAFTPTNPTAIVGQPFTVTAVIKNAATNAPVPGGFAWIEKIVKTADSSTAYDAGTSPGKVAVDAATGSAALTYALSPGGSYTVDVCYQQSTTTSCLLTPRAFVIFISTGATTTPQTQTTPTPAGSDAATTTSGAVSIPNPIRCNTAQCLITQVIRYVFGIIAVLATFMFIWGGVLMLTSAGNAQRVKQAKDTLTYAAIGIVVILLSWSAIQFVINGIK